MNWIRYWVRYVRKGGKVKGEGVGGALGLNTLCIGKLKSNINIGSKLELITPYHIKFVVK